MQIFYSVYFFFLLIIFSFLVEGCDIINPEEGIPGYIQIDSFKVITDKYTQGTSSSNISDVWLTLDGNYQGIYELPVKFPVLETGERNLIFWAGIKNNGIAADRERYEFYTRYEIDTKIESGDVLKITPQVSYKESVNFKLMEDFEDPGLKLVSTYKSDTGIIHSDIDVFEGNRSGLIALDSLHTYFECKSFDSLFLPVNMTKVYVEMDYNSDLNLKVSGNSFSVGLFVTSSSSYITDPIIYLNETKGEWNKIYIDFTDALNEYPSALYFHLFIGATNAGDSLKEAHISIDNIKVLTYEDE